MYTIQSWSEYGSFEADGDTWVPPGEAKQELAWTQGQLANAKKRGCLLTDWKPLRHRPITVRGRVFEFIARSHIDQIKAKRELLKGTDQDNQDEISIEEAGRIANRCGKTMRELARKIGYEKRPGLSKNGRVSKRVILSKAKLLELLRAQEAKVPEDRMMVSEAVAFLRVNEGTVFDWCHRGCIYLGGRPIDFVEDKVPVRQAVRTKGAPGSPAEKKLIPKNGYQLSRADVLEIKQAMGRMMDRPFTDSRGTWIPEPLAERRYGVTQRILRHHLSRGRLEVEKVPYYTANRRTAYAWFYLESSLSRARGSFGDRRRNSQKGGAPNPARVKSSQGRSEPRGRKRPSREKHLKWRNWRSAGLSYNQIAQKHLDETGEVVTRDAVIQALRRL